MKDHLFELFSGHDTTELLINTLSVEIELTWSVEAKQELSKIQGFIIGKVKWNTENLVE